MAPILYRHALQQSGAKFKILKFLKQTGPESFSPAIYFTQDDLLPVMVFVYGGGYKAGTQMKMGYERLGDVNDVVLVAVNYRL
jgi:hypothetical protein